MCKKSGKLAVGLNIPAKKAVIMRPDCGSWACDECAQRMLNLHLARIIKATHELGGAWTFITVTAHEKWRGESSLENLKKGWTKLTERLRRLNGTRHYVLIHELHADGTTFHFHMLYNGKVTKTWLKKNSRACGLGYMADAQTLKDPKAGGAYVTKYLTKSLTETRLPKRFKRVRYSVGFPKLEFDKESEYNVWYTENATSEAFRLIRNGLKLQNFSITLHVVANMLTSESMLIYDD